MERNGETFVSERCDQWLELETSYRAVARCSSVNNSKAWACDNLNATTLAAKGALEVIATAMSFGAPCGVAIKDTRNTRDDKPQGGSDISPKVSVRRPPSNAPTKLL